MRRHISGKPAYVTNQEFINVVNEATENELSRAVKKRMLFKKHCVYFESKYKMDSEHFLKKFTKGKFHEKSDYFDWFSAKTGFDMWGKKIVVLDKLCSSKCIVDNMKNLFKKPCLKKYNIYTS